MERVREEKRGKLTLRIVTAKVGYSGVVNSDKGQLARVDGNDPVELWRRLEQEAAKSSKDYVGFDGARTRFLRFFPGGFDTTRYASAEREYKLQAKHQLDTTVPLDQARTGSGFGEAALAVYRKTNLLFQIEKARVTELLRGPSADGFVRAAARVASGEGASALADMAQLAKRHNAASWTAITYLPFLWRPEQHMFLKPQVTKDFAERVGHRFVHAYRAAIDMTVYDSLLDLVARTRDEIADLHPRDRIDVQSFIWVVGAYNETDAFHIVTAKREISPGMSIAISHIVPHDLVNDLSTWNPISPDRPDKQPPLRRPDQSR
jgi:hypothetical protein